MGVNCLPKVVAQWCMTESLGYVVFSLKTHSCLRWWVASLLPERDYVTFGYWLSRVCLSV